MKFLQRMKVQLVRPFRFGHPIPLRAVSSLLSKLAQATSNGSLWKPMRWPPKAATMPGSCHGMPASPGLTPSCEQPAVAVMDCCPVVALLRQARLATATSPQHRKKSWRCRDAQQRCGFATATGALLQQSVASHAVGLCHGFGQAHFPKCTLMVRCLLQHAAPT